jgi:acetyl esterase/lipase
MRVLRLLILLLAAVVIVVAVKPVRVAAQTVVLLPSLMDADVRPLEWLTGEPTVLSLPYRGERSLDLADLWLPSSATAERPVGGVLLVFGVNNVGRDHPAIRRVAGALARSGVAVMVPDSAVLLEGRLEAGEVDGIVRAFEALRDRPEIDASRVGMAGFSAGGSLALLAAADPRIAADVRYVNAFGAFADARDYVAELAAHAYPLGGREVQWPPTRLALEGFPKLVLNEVRSARDRRLLSETLEASLASGTRPAFDPDVARRLGPRARSFYRLLVAPDLATARAAVARLPADTRATLAALSPVRHLRGIEAPVHLMHERDDHHVPYVESRRLAEALQGRDLLVRYTEFRLFTHVQPDDLDPLAAAPELWKLLWHVHALMTETVA